MHRATQMSLSQCSASFASARTTATSKHRARRLDCLLASRATAPSSLLRRRFSALGTPHHRPLHRTRVTNVAVWWRSLTSSRLAVRPARRLILWSWHLLGRRRAHVRVSRFTRVYFMPCCASLRVSRYARVCLFTRCNSVSVCRNDGFCIQLSLVRTARSNVLLPTQWSTCYHSHLFIVNKLLMTLIMSQRSH